MKKLGGVCFVCSGGFEWFYCGLMHSIVIIEKKKKKKMVEMGGRREEKDETGYTLITGCMNECEKIFKNLEKIMIKNSVKKKGG